MKSLLSMAITVPFATAMLFAQAAPADRSSDQAGAQSQSSTQTQKDKSSTSSTTSQSSRTAGQADSGAAKTYTGTIVDANCSEASSLSSSSSSSSAADQSASTSSRSASAKSKSPDDARKDVLRHCAPKSSTTSFAILTDDGNFLKLDENGNTQVKSNKLNGKSTKVTVTGTAMGDTLNVQSISKM